MEADPYHLRPLTPADAAAGRDVTDAAITDLELRLGERPDPDHDAPERVARGIARVEHCTRSDPGGSWGAFQGDAMVGITLAIRREGIWGLSLLMIHPAHQSRGLGRRLLTAALGYAEGCRGAIIMSSPDPRAIRSYTAAGFDLYPAVQAKGPVVRETIPGGLRVREDAEADLDLVDAVDAAVRGASHRDDIPFMTRWQGRFISVADGSERGYAVVQDGPLLLAATGAAVAQRLLWAAIALTEGDECRVSGVDGRQQWAFEVLVAARLPFSTAWGGVLNRGAVGPMTPYIPSGQFL